MTVKFSDLPLEISPGPFRAQFHGERGDNPIVFCPGWILLDRDGNVCATVSRGIDAMLLAELLNGKKP